MRGDVCLCERQRRSLEGGLGRGSAWVLRGAFGERRGIRRRGACGGVMRWVPDIQALRLGGRVSVDEQMWCPALSGLWVGWVLCLYTQGDALGFVVAPLWGWRR